MDCASSKTRLNCPSSASMVSLLVMKLMFALFTPASFWMSHSILAAQFAQSRSCSLYERFIGRSFHSSCAIARCDDVPSLADVGEALGQHGVDVRIGQGVDHALAVAAELHQVRLLQQPQLVGNGALSGADHVRNIAHAAFALHQRVEDLDARGVREHLEEIRQFVEQFVFRHGLEEAFGGGCFWPERAALGMRALQDGFRFFKDLVRFAHVRSFGLMYKHMNNCS